MTDSKLLYVFPAGNAHRWHIAVTFDEKTRTARTQCGRLVFVMATHHSAGPLMPGSKLCGQCKRKGGGK